MKQKSGPDKAPAEQVLKDIRRQTRRQYSAEEKIRIVLEGLRGEESISELCRREGIAASMYYGWSAPAAGRLNSNPDEPEPPFSKCLISLKLSADGQARWTSVRSRGR